MTSMHVFEKKQDLKGL